MTLIRRFLAHGSASAARAIRALRAFRPVYGWVAVAALVAGCSTPPAPPPPAPPAPPPPAPLPEPEPAPAPAPIAELPAAPRHAKVSQAQSAREYRRDAAAHLYEKNAGRIFAGKLPPMLQAVGVLEVDIDPQGRVLKIGWLRAPRHVPQVMADIERAVYAAAPFPAPVKLGRVTYTDTWLWHQSGRFQLDTLTEGQR